MPDDVSIAQRLWDIEQIKQLKARYFRFVDTRDWPAVIALFHPECEMRSTVFAEVERPDHAAMLALYRDLLRLRRDHADLRDPWLTRVEVEFDEKAGWLIARRGSLRVIVSLAHEERRLPVSCDALLFTTDAGSGPVGDEVVLQSDSAVIVRPGISGD